MTVKLIVAVNHANFIGRDNQLLYRIPSDLERFKKLTTGTTVVMGRKTWESLPQSVRPLPGRQNVVFTRNPHYDVGAKAHNVQVLCNLSQYLLVHRMTNKTVWVIGGEEVYRAALPYAGEVHVSVINDRAPGDAVFPVLPVGEFVCQSSKTIPALDDIPEYRYQVWVRRVE